MNLNFTRSAFLLALLVASTGLQAQNTSYNVNSVPILGSANVGIGVNALISNTQYFNTAVGTDAFHANTTGINNTAVGNQAMGLNGAGSNNSVMGNFAMYAAGSASNCVSIGDYSAYNNTGSYNTVVGSRAMLSNSSGAQNTAVGFEAMYYNNTGYSNTAVGYRTLSQNTGTGNAAVGERALGGNTSGNYNAAVGFEAMFYNTTGVANSAIGYKSLWGTGTGSYNSGLGSFTSLTFAGTTNSTALGYNAISNNSNKIRLGSTTVTKVEGPVAYTVSDGRFKTNVREDDVKGLAFIQKLRPVVYNFETRAFTEFLTLDMPDSMRQHYLAEDFKHSTAIRQSGFIAQEVEAAAKAAGYDFNGVSAPTHKGDNYSLAYAQFVVPLVKGMQEQQAMIEKRDAEVVDLKSQLAAQQTQIAELSALVHKLTAVTGTAPSDKAPVVTAEAAPAILVFPNPSQGRFTLRIPAEWTGVLQVSDMRGRSVLRQTLLPGNPEYQLDLTAQPKGSYLLQLEGRDGTRQTEKLVVE